MKSIQARFKEVEYTEPDLDVLLQPTAIEAWMALIMRDEHERRQNNNHEIYQWSTTK